MPLFKICQILRKQNDAVLNILLPLLTGSLLYMLKTKFPISGAINNHLADGLWAYAFMSTILIIWDRKLPVFWMAAVPFCGAAFELLQMQGYLQGTGDIFDILSYLLFSSLAILMNQVIINIKVKTAIRPDFANSLPLP